MGYYFSKKINTTFEDAEERVTGLLTDQGFGVLTEIDVQKTLRKKLDVEFYNYKILGACNPPFAHQALLAEDKIGTMLPCNIVLQEKEAGIVEVSAVNPLQSMSAVKNEALEAIAEEVTARLKRVIEQL